MVPISPKRSVRGRKGFSLIAIVVTVVILAVLAAVILPYLTESTHELSAVRTAEILRTLELDLNNTVASNGLDGFCQRVTTCPSQLQHLTRQITTADRQGCNTTALYKAAEVSNWIANAPYSGLPIVPGYGVWTPLGVIHDSTIKHGVKDTIELHMDSLPLNDAISLDIAIDGVNNATTGQLVYSATAVNTSGQTLELVTYRIKATGKCA